MFIINTKDFYVNNFILTHNQHKKVTPGILLCKVQNTKKKKETNTTKNLWSMISESAHKHYKLKEKNFIETI